MNLVSSMSSCRQDQFWPLRAESSTRPASFPPTNIRLEAAKSDTSVDGIHKSNHLRPICESQGSIFGCLATETKDLARSVPGLTLRGSIPEALRLGVASQLEANDIDLLIISDARARIDEKVASVYAVLEAKRKTCPHLFEYRNRITVDVRTHAELSYEIGWYEWVLCKADTITVGLPFRLRRNLQHPTLVDLLDYMEYLTYIGVRSCLQVQNRYPRNNARVLRKIQRFLHVVSTYLPNGIRMPSFDRREPFESFDRILQTIREQARIAEIKRRATLLNEWCAFWEAARVASESGCGLDGLARRLSFTALIEWRLAGKKWLLMDIESRFLWRRCQGFQHRDGMVGNNTLQSPRVERPAWNSIDR